MTCCCFVFCFLDGFSRRKHLDDDFRLAHNTAFVSEGIDSAFFLLSSCTTSFLNLCDGLLGHSRHTSRQVCFLKKKSVCLVRLKLRAHPRPRGQPTPRRCPWSCSPCRCRSRRRRCARGRWAGCPTPAGWTSAAGPNRSPARAHLSVWRRERRRKRWRREIHKYR